MKKYITILIVILVLPLTTYSNDKKPELNVVYGDNHIFTVETPEGWFNDKKTASSIGLVSLFYPIDRKGKKIMTYFYAMGYDKESKKDTLKGFVESDLSKFKQKYPNLTFKTIKLGHSGNIINAIMHSYDNLIDRYKEEVVYMETDYSIFVFSFSAYSQEDYKIYQPVFDKFIASFKYRGNDPKPFLNWQKKKQ